MQTTCSSPRQPGSAQAPQSAVSPSMTPTMPAWPRSVVGADQSVDRRPLPTDLAAVLRRAREVELDAVTRVQLLDAVRATTVLTAAARREGWRTVELAAGLGMQRKALDRRLHRYPAMRTTDWSSRRRKRSR